MPLARWLSRQTRLRTPVPALVAVLALVLAAPAGAATFGSRTLRRGDRGSDVRTLQSTLTKLGYRTGVDGVFGAGTQASVKRYESRDGLRPDGIVNAFEARRMTAEARGVSYRFGRRTLRRGSRGTDVKALQRTLSELGFRARADGVFGPGTKAAVKGYERSVRRHVDGIVDPPEAREMQRRATGATTGASGSGPTPRTYSLGERTLRRGDRGHDVESLQETLSELGYDTAIDGDFGAATQASVKAYERSVRRHVDGIVDPPEARELQAAAAQAARSGDAAGHDNAFPIRGRHDYGTAANRFGAPRGGHRHQGQDVLAACGTRVVAAQGGPVIYAGFQSAAGNYIVIHGTRSRWDYVYDHLRHPALPKTGDRVRTGETIGYVGQTGDATGCHLHFELWTSPGWYNGGHAFDPLPELERWDRYS